MLKKIPAFLTPELVKYMLEMGHSDRLLLADANYPAATYAKRLIRLEGIEIPDLLKAVLEFFPLDDFIPQPVTLMQHLDTEPVPKIWEDYRRILNESDEKERFEDFRYLERLEFYEKSREAYVIVQTATKARYANIMLQKGVI